IAVRRGQPGLGVDHEHDEVGRVDGDGDLVLDVVGEIIVVGEAHPAGVDQVEVAILLVHQVNDAVAGDAGGGVDHRHPPAGEPVEQRTLADVGSADNDNTGNRHEGYTPPACRKDRQTIETAARTTRRPMVLTHSNRTSAAWHGSGPGV